MSPDRTRVHTVRGGETLAGIAAVEYGSPAAWRAIAEHPENFDKLPNPRRLVAGTVLTLPRLDSENRPVEVAR